MIEFLAAHAERWPRVPGARWLTYARSADAPAPTPRPAAPARRPPPTVARFLLDGPVLPPVADTVRAAEALRRAVMGRYQHRLRRRKYGPAEPPGREPFRSPTLSGKDSAGAFLRSHDHAHYLPTAEDGDRRRLDHLTVYAPGGLGPDEVAALSGLRGLRVGELAVRAQLTGLGRPEDFTAALFGRSRAWKSATPFVSPRHRKRRGRKRDAPELTGPDARPAFLAVVLRELIDRRGLGRVEWVEPGPEVRDGLRPWEYHRGRSRPGDDGPRRPSGYLRVKFAEAIAGPVCLGYASHFGLGLFVPTDG